MYDPNQRSQNLPLLSAMREEELHELLRNAPPFPLRGPQHFGARHAAAPYRNFTQVELASRSAPTLPLSQPRSPSKLAACRSQGLRRLRTIANLVMTKSTSKGVLRSKPPTTMSSKHETSQRASSSVPSIWADAQNDLIEEDLRLSRDSLRLTQAFADLSTTMAHLEQQAQAPWSDTQVVFASPPVAISQALQISTTDAVDYEVCGPSSLPAFFPDSLAGEPSTPEITPLPPAPSSVPTTPPPKSRFREHPELVGPNLHSTPPSTPSARFRFFPGGDNLSQPSITSLGRQSDDLLRLAEPSSWTSRSPFRPLRPSAGHSFSTSSLVTTATSPSPLRPQRTSPEQKNRSNFMRWPGGRFSSGVAMDPDSPLKNAKLRARRASLASLGNLLHLGRGRDPENSSTTGQLQTSQSTVFSPSSDPFASRKPVNLLASRSAQVVGRLPPQEDPNDADISSSPGSHRRSHFRALPRLSINTTGLNSNRSSKGPDEYQLPQAANPFRYSWRPHFSRTSLSQASSSEPSHPSDLQGDKAARRSLWSTMGEDTTSGVAYGHESPDDHAHANETQPQTPSKGGLKRGRAMVRSMGELVNKPGLWLSNSFIETEPQLPLLSSHGQNSIRSPSSRTGEVPELLDDDVFNPTVIPRTPAPSLRTMKSFYFRSMRSLTSMRQRTRVGSLFENDRRHPAGANISRSGSGLQHSRVSTLRGSRRSRMSSISQLTSPDSETVDHALGLSFTGLPTPMPSGEFEQTVENGGGGDARGWNLLQTASPLCSPRHHFHSPPWLRSDQQEQSSEEAECSSGSPFGKKWWQLSRESLTTDASRPPNDHRKVSAFNVATSSTSPFSKSASGPAPRLRRLRDHDADNYLIDLEIASPTLDLLDDIDQIIATSSDFPAPPVRASTPPQSQWLPRA
ncbi:unnamed protein product, partial [Tilletia controversa]